MLSPASPDLNHKAPGLSRAPLRALGLCVIALLALGSAVIAAYVPHAMERAALDAALKGNLALINQVKLMRGYYTQQVVARALATKALEPSMHHAGRPDAIPLPATLVKDLSDLMAKNDTTLALVSPYPWPHRAGRVMDTFETDAWQQFQTDPDKVVMSRSVVNGKQVLRVAVADRLTSETCVNCHNADPALVKRDWKLGDVRAIFEVSRTIDGDLAQTAESSRYIIVGVSIAAFAGAAAILFFIILFERRSRDKRIADRNAYYLAEHDVLTGLKNRARLTRDLDRSFAGGLKDGGYTALLLIDLDGFKPVNDMHGHAIGDQLLIAAAQRMREWAGAQDMVARMGGDEFAIACRVDAQRDDLIAAARALCQRLQEPYEIGTVRILVGASIGIALLHEDAQNTSDLFIAADLALYTAKSSGRGQARRFRPEMTAGALRRLKFEADLKVALAENQFHLHYQPIRDVTTGRIIRVEALLRWQHPERGNVPPGEFIQIAEEIGMIERIGAWVLNTACAEIAALDNHTCLAVNLSTQQISSERILDTIRGALSASGLAPHRLEVEITESVMLKNDEQTMQVLLEIRRLGVEIAIDDFGTGYSCLSYLQRYPVTCLKIDRSFVDPLGRVASARAIVGAIIALAKALNLQTVAEGVETAQQAEELEALGCTAFQGYFYDLPRPIAQIDAARSPASGAL